MRRRRVSKSAGMERGEEKREGELFPSRSPAPEAVLREDCEAEAEEN
jgi:hypothetical protein